MRKIYSISLLAVALTAAACSGSEAPANNSVPKNINTANTNVANSTNTTASNNPLETQKKPEVATTNAAPTLAPVVQAYYDALKKKDDAAIRNVLASDWVKKLDAEMKAEKKKNLAEYMAETDMVPEKPVEVRNEKIEGNRAVAEVKGGTYVNWSAIAFVNEGGQWKLTNESPEIKAVTK